MPPNKPSKAPPASPLCGYYQCHTDNLLYQVAHTDTKNTDLLMQRRTLQETTWRAPYLVEASHIIRLLAFGSFTRIEP
jgi:hypothetical protein